MGGRIEYEIIPYAEIIAQENAEQEKIRENMMKILYLLINYDSHISNFIRMYGKIPKNTSAKI